MDTKTIIITAIIAVAGIVGMRVVLDPPQENIEVAQNEVTETPLQDDEFGQKFTLGDITIMKVQARETVPGANVGGGYMMIKNNGDQDDRLVGGQTSISAMLEVHEMKMENDVMKMRQLNDGIVIKAGETLVLKPGGLHIMFMGLKAPLAKDTSFTATLNFEKAGSVDVEFDVVDMKKLMMAQ